MIFHWIGNLRKCH